MAKKKASPFTEPQLRSSRIRRNAGTWNPLVDTTDIFCGNRSVDRRGNYDLYDGAIGVELRVEHASRSEPLLEGTEPWEQGSVSPLFIWKADNQFKMLYSARFGTCLATSDDAFEWKRPVLNEVEYEGSTENNLLGEGIEGCTGVFIDPYCAPEERFKAMGGDMAWYDPATLEPLDGDEAQKRFDAQEYEGDSYTGPRAVIWGRMLGWTSADGHRWTPMPEMLGNRPVNGGISARYDKDTEHYICYQQIMGYEAEALKGIGSASIEEETQLRTIAFSRTSDFSKWPAPKQILRPDAQDPYDIDFYGANYFPYPGRTDLHGMVVPVYHRASDNMDSQLAFSRDGLFWTRTDRRVAAATGEPGSGDECGTHCWRSGLLELPDGRWAVPHTGTSRLHNVRDEVLEKLQPLRRPGQIRYAIWEPHRFCGIEAELEGRFTIPSIYRKENQLRFNYRCAPAGWISVELLQRNPTMFQPDLDPVPGFTFADCDRLLGDETDRAVTWNGNGDISTVGESVVMRIRMFQAKLFAYRL